MHAHTSAIQNIFGDKLFATPVSVGSSWGAAPATTYRHVSTGTFPVKLTKICGKQMVSLSDFISFLQGDGEQSQATSSSSPSTKKRGRGRPTNKERSALASQGGV